MGTEGDPSNMSVRLVTVDSLEPPGGEIMNQQFSVQDLKDAGGNVGSQGSSSEGEEELNSLGSPGNVDQERPVARPQPPVKRKRTEPVEFIENYQNRAQKARRTGRKLERQIRDFTIATGAKVQFRAEFAYKNGSKLILEAGDKIQSEADTSLNLSGVRDEVRSAVEESFAGIRRSPTPGPSSAAASSSIFSPSTHLPERLDTNKCRICKKREVSEGLIEYSSEWVLCTLKDECNYRVHADCLGFPGMKRGRNTPKFYCPQHRQQGRQREGVRPSFGGDRDEDEEETEPPPVRGRGTRRRLRRAGRT